MNKRWTGSDWYIPSDWLWHISNLVGIVVVVPMMIAVSFWVFRAKHGDPTLLYVAVAAGLVGIVLLAIARWPLYKQGKVLAIGPKHLNGIHRKLYWLAYVFIGASIILILRLLVALK